MLSIVVRCNYDYKCYTVETRISFALTHTADNDDQKEKALLIFYEINIIVKISLIIFPK